MIIADRGRIEAVDFARGLALAGMIVFHMAWDLHAFGFTRSDPSVSAVWWLFGRGIAGSFLALSGLGLVLARQRGERGGAAVRRIGLIAAAACGVSAATGLVAPRQVVLFGILHCIAACNLAALPLLGRRIWLVPAIAAMALALPWLAGGALPDTLWWTGLASQAPDTLDYQPLFPSFGVVLLGVALGETGRLQRLRRMRFGHTRPTRLICAAGRRSLLIYLLHQPVLFAGLWGLALVVTPANSGGFDADAFIARCIPACTAAGTDHATCEAACRCVTQRLRNEKVQLNDPNALTAAARMCTPDIPRLGP